MKGIIYRIFLVIAFMAYLLPVFAQSGVGKIGGRILDADTKEPLIGANVVIVGTESGAATDADGRYYVLNIIPGTYDVRISYVGYGTKIMKDVRIVAGITFDLNLELSSSFTTDEIVITGKKFFEEKATNTVKVLDSDQINRLPVKGVEKLASLQAGVVMAEGSGGADGNATINVRGGRGGEVLYIVDGVPQNDLFTGANNAQVSNSAIEQLSFQIGGYEAKYGQAQSGIINVTTKSGEAKYALFGDVMSSSFTDDYGYNLYTMNLSGPVFPGVNDHTIFISGERGWFKDADPKAIPLEIPTAGINQNYLPNNSSSIWRYTVRTYHNLSPFSVRLGANINFRDSRAYTHSYAKNNSEHNPLTKSGNYSYSARISQNITKSSFWNLNLGYKLFDQESGDGVWFDNIEAYGDTTWNAPYVTTQGTRVSLDAVQLFYGKGRVSNSYTKLNNGTMSADLDFTSQLDKHLLEVGGGFQYNTLRYFGLAPAAISIDNKTKSLKERIALQTPFYFGYDITGKEFSDDNFVETIVSGTDTNDYFTKVKPRNPVIGYFYVQDRFELSDLVINLGIRYDYFDSKADIVKNEEYPFIYGDPNNFDAADFTTKDPEQYISPRIGLGFPVTSSTVFHAQYGKFIQQPTLVTVYTSVNSLNDLVKDDNFGVNTGNVNSEVTTQYEIGFRQVVGDNFGALNLTAFYKNTKGLINDETRFFYRSAGGQRARYYGPSNSDFGTIKGVALSLNVSRLSYLSFNIDYTYSIAEGTGSSTSSSTTAAFRNTNGETPKVIAPLDFDQRHTGVINADFTVPEGDLGVFEGTSVNVLFSFASGRPYTPLLMQNITPGGGSNLGDTKGYVNSAYGPGTNRIDLKVEKMFKVAGIFITPYLWVENLLDADNSVNVYRSTGSPYTSGYLTSKEGMALAKQRGPSYVSDYTALERDPTNYGIPRLIKLGLRVNFAGLSF